MICMSRAADRPWCQLGRRMSAGRRNESGMTPEASLHGARAPRLGCSKEYVTEGVMTRYSVTVSPTANLMVPEHVSSAVTLRAWVRVRSTMHRHTQPISEAASELSAT